MTEQEPAALTDDVRLADPALAIKTPAHKQVLYKGANAPNEEEPPAGGFSVWCSKKSLRKKRRGWASETGVKQRLLFEM